MSRPSTPDSIESDETRRRGDSDVDEVMSMFDEIVAYTDYNDLGDAEFELSSSQTAVAASLKTQGARVRNVVSKGREKLRDLVLTKRTELQSKLKHRREMIERRFHEPVVLQLMEKVSFFLGVLNMLLTQLIFADYPHYMYLWYTVWISLLMVFRYFLYHKEKWHYFLLDFCYFTNAMLLWYLYMYPSSPVLFRPLFAMANGPLALAIVAWRNSIVFHSLDKMTSVFIHILPPIVTFCLRWYPQSPFCACSADPNDTDCTLTLGDFLRYLLIYSVWQLFYFLKTEQVDKLKMAQDSHILTSFRWMKQDESHIMHRLMKGFPEHLWIVSFMLQQFIYTLISYPLTILMFQHKSFHLAYLIFVVLVAIWNGGSFYVYFLSKKRHKTD